jgi:voltage-gated potassium channel
MSAPAVPILNDLERGRLTALVKQHTLAWEVAMAVLTLLYVALSVIVDEGGPASAQVAVAVLALLFLVEFAARCWDSKSRLGYLREHWIDLITCLPFIGPLRLLRLLRLVGLLRLAHEIRDVAYIRSETAATPQSVTWIVWPTALLLWLGAAYGLWIAEKGHNTAIHNFADALYMAFITVTTVGYGDLRPVTPEGKVLAGALVFFGLGLLGFISAQLTARWLRVENRENAVETQILALRTEIAGLRELLLQVSSTGRPVQAGANLDASEVSRPSGGV